MSEMAQFLNRKRAYSTAIQRIDYPTHQGKPNPVHGHYYLVGTIPGALSEPNANSLVPGARRSMRFPTLQACINALLAAGVTRFQLPDCSWYAGTTTQAGE